MEADSAGVFKRWGAALAAVAFGWFACYCVWTLVAPGAGAHDRASWAGWTGGFCVSAWALFGLPLAAINPDLSSPLRIVVAVVICGLTGDLILLIFFMGLNLVFGLLAFLTAATSMLVYVFLLRAILPKQKSAR